MGVFPSATIYSNIFQFTPLHAAAKSGCLSTSDAEIGGSERKTANDQIIHPSIYYSHLFCTKGGGEAGAYPSDHRVKAGCTLDKSPVYHRAMIISSQTKAESPLRHHAAL